MKISVIVCTYNRCRDLGNALASLCASRVADSAGWEVLVVDNNSTDATRSVVEQFARSHPSRFVYLFEPIQGKSHALNRGVRHSQADIVAFTDDDVRVEPDWLENLAAPLRTGRYVGAAGRTFAMPEFAPPRWLSLEGRFALAPLALFDRGAESMDLMESPFGNNMAFRREAFERYGYFRTDLGPRPGSANPQKSEDSDFGERLIAAGERLRYQPSAVLYHLVPPERVSKTYFLSWWYDKARSDVRAFGLPDLIGQQRLAGVPVILFRRLMRWTLQWVFSPEPAQRFSCQTQVWSVAGVIRECYRQTREPSSTPAPDK